LNEVDVEVALPTNKALVSIFRRIIQVQNNNNIISRVFVRRNILNNFLFFLRKCTDYFQDSSPCLIVNGDIIKYHKHMSKCFELLILKKVNNSPAQTNIEAPNLPHNLHFWCRERFSMPSELSYAEVAASTTNGVSDHSDSDTTATESPKDLQKRGHNLVGQTKIKNEPNDKPYSNSIAEAPITVERKSYVSEPNEILIDAGTARATLAASKENPNGTTEGDWAANHQHQTVRLCSPIHFPLSD
jgi:hypothetical protein